MRKMRIEVVDIHPRHERSARFGHAFHRKENKRHIAEAKFDPWVPVIAVWQWVLALRQLVRGPEPEGGRDPVGRRKRALVMKRKTEPRDVLDHMRHAITLPQPLGKPIGHNAPPGRAAAIDAAGRDRVLDDNART